VQRGLKASCNSQRNQRPMNPKEPEWLIIIYPRPPDLAGGRELESQEFGWLIALRRVKLEGISQYQT